MCTDCSSERTCCTYTRTFVECLCFRWHLVRHCEGLVHLAVSDPALKIKCPAHNTVPRSHVPVLYEPAPSQAKVAPICCPPSPISATHRTPLCEAQRDTVFDKTICILIVSPRRLYQQQPKNNSAILCHSTLTAGCLPVDRFMEFSTALIPRLILGR